MNDGCIARRRGRGLGAPVALLALLGATGAWAATATFTGTSAGQQIQGTTTTPPNTFANVFAGVFLITIDGGPQTNAYCVDINNPISVGESEPQVAPDYPCEVVYILNNAYPTANNIAGRLSNLNQEAASVQAAIWHYTDTFNPTGPSAIVARANQIITAAQSQCQTVPPVPQSITMSPAAQTNIFETDGTNHTVTATVRDTNGALVTGYAIAIEVAGISGPITAGGVTDGSGQFGYSYSSTAHNPGQASGTDTITASVAFTAPVGLKFKKAGKQGIVLAGSPRAGTVTGTATKTWLHDTCGNGVRGPGELCDDGNATNGDGCDNNCTTTACGNGIRTAGEQCDDGNLISGDGCDANCTPTACGNGVTSAPEECDDGNTTSDDGCDANCTFPRCGNGITNAGEQCDDANATIGDGCDPNCTFPRCGNRVIDPSHGEECDDGNTSSGDGCDANCTLPTCGNGVITPPEVCDDHNQTNGDGCDSNCTPTRCGNGIRTGSEQCDDGNTANGDGCEANCTLPTCGNLIVDPGLGEQCDDGNTNPGDGCDACRLREICGNLVDDDGDCRFDCDDPDCTDCAIIYNDPAAIVFRPNDWDLIKIQGGVVVSDLGPTHQIAPATDRMTFLVTNVNSCVTGPVYAGDLLGGDLIAKGNPAKPKYNFKDRTARKPPGPGVRDGLYKVNMFLRENIWHVKFQAYGEMQSKAALPTMTTQICLVGADNVPDCWVYKSDWRLRPNGWHLDFPVSPPTH